MWFHRRQLHGRDLWTKGVLPGLGAAMLLVVFVLSAVDYATPSEDGTSLFGLGGQSVVAIGALLLGGVVMVGYGRVAPSFFRGPELPRRIARTGALSACAVDASAPSSDAFTPDEATTEAVPVTVFASVTPPASDGPAGHEEAQGSPRPRHRLYGLADPRQFDDR